MRHKPSETSLVLSASGVFVAYTDQQNMREMNFANELTYIDAYYKSLRNALHSNARDGKTSQRYTFSIEIIKDMIVAVITYASLELNETTNRQGDDIAIGVFFPPALYSQKSNCLSYSYRQIIKAIESTQNASADELFSQLSISSKERAFTHRQIVDILTPISKDITSQLQSAIIYNLKWFVAARSKWRVKRLLNKRHVKGFNSIAEILRELLQIDRNLSSIYANPIDEA